MNSATDYTSLLRFTVERLARAQRPDLSTIELGDLVEALMEQTLKSDHAELWRGRVEPWQEPLALATLEAANEGVPDLPEDADWRAEYEASVRNRQTCRFKLVRGGGEPLAPDPAITRALAHLSAVEQRRYEAEQS